MFRRKPTHRDDLIAALDIGTTRVCCAIARVQENQKFEVIGCGQHMSRGLRRGVIIDMEAISSAIAHAVHSAERQAEETIKRVHVGVPASVLVTQVFEFHTQIEGHPVQEEDLEGLLAQAQEIMAEKHLEILHAIPLSYQLDENRGIQDPKGMYGEKLSVKLFVIAAPSNVLRNFIASINSCHLDIAGFVAAPHASALATLVQDEMELGTTLIDMGGGTTALISYLNGRPVYSTSVPLGGAHITQDIARVFSTPLLHAERLKTLYGSAVASTSDERDTIMVPQVGEEAEEHGSSIQKYHLNQVIQPRLDEIFTHLKARLHSQAEGRLLSRVVLTGGASQLTGIREFVITLLGKNVRLGTVSQLPSAIPLSLGPSFATCTGILIYASREVPEITPRRMQALSSESLWGRITMWVRENV